MKATGLGKYFPFYLTDAEARWPEDLGGRFHLFRVFDLARSPRLYVLRGSMRQACRLAPTLYKAGLGGGAA